MATQSPLPAQFVFGPFQVDAATGELRRNGTRVRLSGQPFRILLALLERPGELVTRDQLRALVWPDEIFVDFEHGLNAAVNKLRRALGDTADDPRYIETHASRGYRFIGTLQSLPPAEVLAPGVAAAPEALPLDSRPPTIASGRRDASPWRWFAVTTVLAGTLAAGWYWLRPAPAPLPWKLTQLTSGTGTSEAPALSSDGKLLAYSSDGEHEGERDLYVKQVTGGQPIRITFDGAGNTAPDFSPDGSKIVFQSTRDGGGVYEIAAFGGEARLLARHGMAPRFSPDGMQVADWGGDVNRAATIPGSGQVWVVEEATGGEPRRVGARFTAARYPIWSPDSRNLLFIGYTSTKLAESASLDWWLAPIDGSTPRSTGAAQALIRAGLRAADPPSNLSAAFPNVPEPACWLAGSNSIIFSTPSGDTRNLWETTISPRSGRVSGEIKRLTAGAGNEIEPSCASADLVAFTNVETKSKLWSLAYKANQESAAGSLQAVTAGPFDREPSVSADGRWLAFVSTQSGPLNIWLHDVASGEDSHVAASPMVQRFPLINAAGSRIAFSAFEERNRSIYLAAVATAHSPAGLPQKLCDACLRATSWSADESTLLIFGGSPYQIEALDVATHRRTALLKHPAYNLLFGRFSPESSRDGKRGWISFTARTQPNRAILAVAPLDQARPIPESAWIRISEEQPEDRADWSPDGRTLYFTSRRDGHTCLYGQRLDLATRRPVGDAFAVQHFHGAISYQQAGWSIAQTKITVGLTEGTSNIWSMSRVAVR